MRWQTVPVRLAAGLTALALAVLPATPGVAAPVAQDSSATRAAGEVVCTVDDPRAVELSGLVATPDGYVSIVDSRANGDEILIVYLDAACQVVRTQGYPTRPRDPEDLAVAPDGALWVADLGDSITDPQRPTIALWRIPPDGGMAVLHHLTYPDGPHDAEALLFAADGTPVVITKELGSASYLYQAIRVPEPDPAGAVPMRLVGEFHPDITSDPTDLAQLIEAMVTGAAIAPDRSRVALRTYAAAYEWDVPDGDIVKAITTAPPLRTPLPGEPQGEAIAYTVDGQWLLTVSDVAGPSQIVRYPAAVAPAPETATITATPTASGPTTPGFTDLTRWGSGLRLAGPVIILGATLWWLLRRRRRRHR